MKPFCLTFFVFTCAAGALVGNTGTLQLTVRDSRTHYAVHAIIEGSGPKSFSIATDDTGRAKLVLPVGEYQLRVVASDYAPFSTHFPVQAGKTTGGGAFVDPLVVPAEESSSVLDPLIRPGRTLLHEYVVDGETGKPLIGVSVSFVHAGVQAHTDANGHFVLSVLTPPPETPDGIGTDTLVYKKPGYKTIKIRNFGIASEEMGRTGIEMEKGSGTIDIDGTHKLMRK